MWMIFTLFTGFVTRPLLYYVLLCFLGPKTCGIKPAPPAVEGKSYPLDHQGSPQGGGFEGIVFPLPSYTSATWHAHLSSGR